MELFRPEGVRAVSLDVNGTLIHSPRLGAIYGEVLRRHGLEVESDRLESAIRQAWTEFDCARRPGEDRFSVGPGGAPGFWSRFADRVCDHLGLEPPSRFAKVELYDRFSKAEAWVVFGEVFDVLRELDDCGVRLAVLSNWDERLPRLLTDLSLSSFFETIVFSSQVGAEKPFPEIFSQLLENLDLPPEAVLHVGDRWREDVEGALGVGMQALHLCRKDDGDGLRDLRPLVGALVGSRPTRSG